MVFCPVPTGFELSAECLMSNDVKSRLSSGPMDTLRNSKDVRWCGDTGNPTHIMQLAWLDAACHLVGVRGCRGILLGRVQVL